MCARAIAFVAFFPGLATETLEVAYQEISLIGGLASALAGAVGGAISGSVSASISF